MQVNAMQNAHSLSSLATALKRAVTSLPTLRAAREDRLHVLQNEYEHALVRFAAESQNVSSGLHSIGLVIDVATIYAVVSIADVLTEISKKGIFNRGDSHLQILFSKIATMLQTTYFNQASAKWIAAQGHVNEQIKELIEIQRQIERSDVTLHTSIRRVIAVRNKPTDDKIDHADLLYAAINSATLCQPSILPTLDAPCTSISADKPNRQLLAWTLRFADPTNPALPLIAWANDVYTQTAQFSEASECNELIELILAKSPVVRLSQDPQIQTQSTCDLRSFYVRPPDSPKLSYKKQRKQSYVTAHGYVRTTFAEENNIANEDHLLYEMSGNDFFTVVSDGASQSLMSYIAARHVSEYLYRLWCETERWSDYSQLELRTRSALYAAKYAAHAETSLAVDALFANNTYPQSTLELLRKRQKSGSQAIFACVFRRNDVLTCIWMGNSRIFIEGGTSGVVIPHNDARFSDDQSRFGSAAPMGTYGTLYIQQFDTKNGTDQDFLSVNDKWRILIHSDALDVYEEPDHLYRAPLQPPALFPVNIDAELLDKCIDHDDTTIIEIYYEGPHASPPGPTA
jgi:hypothetical protein